MCVKKKMMMMMINKIISIFYYNMNCIFDNLSLIFLLIQTGIFYFFVNNVGFKFFLELPNKKIFDFYDIDEKGYFNRGFNSLSTIDDYIPFIIIIISLILIIVDYFYLYYKFKFSYNCINIYHLLSFIFFIISLIGFTYLSIKPSIKKDNKNKLNLWSIENIIFSSIYFISIISFIISYIYLKCK